MDELRSEILELEKSLDSKKKKLFNMRLAKIYGKTNEETIDISNINIVVDPSDNTWQISYLHHTDTYDPSAYAYDESADDSNNEDPTIAARNTSIVFGKAKKYFIKGGIKLNVYRNSTGELRIINPDYEFDLDLEEQKKLMLHYSENNNLPEWLAIKVLLYISDNKWDDQSIINHFSVI